MHSCISTNTALLADFVFLKNGPLPRRENYELFGGIGRHKACCGFCHVPRRRGERVVKEIRQRRFYGAFSNSPSASVFIKAGVWWFPQPLRQKARRQQVLCSISTNGGKSTRPPAPAEAAARPGETSGAGSCDEKFSCRQELLGCRRLRQRTAASSLRFAATDVERSIYPSRKAGMRRCLSKRDTTG